MSSIDLNIVQRGLTGNDWTAEKGAITSAQLDKVGEQKVNNGAALNSLPTPFARFFVVSEAYRRVLEEKRDPENESGIAYKRLVSDSLDVLELLYYSKYHNNQWDGKRKIIIKEWSYAENLPKLINDVPILGNIIEKYYKSDLGNSMNTLYFVVLQENGHEYLLGTSSPMTLFVTPPDLDKKNLVEQGVAKTIIVGSSYKDMSPIKRKGKGYYFLDEQLFEDRPSDFKNYLYSLFSQGSVSPLFSNFQKYIQAFNTDRDININWQSTLEPILTTDNSKLAVNGIEIKSESGIKSVNFLADKIAKIPYRINTKKFVGISYNVSGENRKYDYLLPLTHEAFEHIDVQDIQCRCQEKSSWIEVSLYNNGELLQSKRYVESGPGTGDGLIIDLAKKGHNLGLGLFPNILSSKPEENNYFKIMLVTSDSNEELVSFTVKDIDCIFYKEREEIKVDTDGTYAKGIKPCLIRTLQTKQDSDSSSKFYEVFNTDFDAISLQIPDGMESPIECAIVPIWDKCVQTQKSMTYAIDLGTTNTYISCRQTGQMLQPVQLVMNSPMVSYLQEPIKNEQMQKILRSEGSLPKSIKPSFDTEFVPAFIDGSIYRFPIRTALCKVENIKSELSLFDNTNIAFCYEKQIPNGNQEIDTNVKWSEDEDNLRIFIRELLLIIKCNVLKSNCSLTDTNLVWFRPLSFRGAVLQNFQSIWEEEAKNVLNIGNPSVQVQVYTESEAPYYYFKQENTIKTTSSVAIVDIGGGSTDFVYLDNSVPKLANSIHFGCDVLWGNGFNAFTDARGNGIYQRYKDVISFQKPELQALNEKMKNSKMSTKDIIDFWISNDRETRISRNLRADFKPYFLYHFTSIIYYMALMFKNAGLDSPRVITFSGNGSRYIDQYLTADSELRAEIVTDILKCVYPDIAQNVQIILPDVRKECTCYGGLYRTPEAPTPRPYYFIGCGNKDYQNIKEIIGDFPKVLKPGIKKEIETVNKAYLNVLGKMSKAGEVSLGAASWIYKELDKGIEDTLDAQFQLQVKDKYSEDEVYNDTLFFLPIIEILYNMSNNLNTKVE